MKKKQTILILGLIFTLAAVLQAQPVVKGLRSFKLEQVSKTLTQRVNTSYFKARQALYTTTPRFLTPGPRHGELIRPSAIPAQKLTRSLNLKNPSTVYPNRTFLTTNEQVEKYFLSQNNRAIHKELKYLADQSEKVADHMATFKKEAALCEQPEQQIPWLVDRISPDINYLFVGEYHHKPEVRRAMAQLLQGLKQKFPHREIIVLTELLPDNLSTEEMWKSVSQQSTLEGRMEIVSSFEHVAAERLNGGVWETLQAYHIPVVGLEPSFVWDNAETYFKPEEAQDTQNFNIWWSDEGSRLRHAHWEQRIRSWREQHPDALFVIHGGQGHFDYFRSGAISKHFPREQRLSVNLFPQKHFIQDATGNVIETADYIGWFAEITQNQFPQHTLYWQTENSALLSGFDYQLKVPPLK